MQKKVVVYYAYKIKDGIYIGNQRAPFEKDFLAINKINNIINCAASQLKISENKNVLNFDWLDDDEQIIITPNNVDQIYHFIEEASLQGEGVLLCSMNGQSRSLAALTAYFMRKYSWGLYKILQFLNTRRQDFQIRASFLKQLVSFENSYFKDKACSRNWEDQQENTESYLLKNTYLNSLPLTQDSQSNQPKQASYSKSLNWSQDLNQYINAAFESPKEKGFHNKSILKKDKNVFKSIRPKLMLHQNQETNLVDYLEQSTLLGKQPHFVSPKPNPLIFNTNTPQKAQDGSSNIFKHKIRLKQSNNPITAIIKKPETIQQQLLQTYLEQGSVKHGGRKPVKTRFPSPEVQKFRSISNQDVEYKKIQNSPLRNMNKWIINRSKSTRKQVPQFKIK